MQQSQKPQQTNHLMDITPRPEQVFVRGEGSWLWDSSNRRYLDFVQGWAVNCLGHSPCIVRDALTTQAGQLLSPSPAYFNQPAIDLAERIARHSVFDQVFLANSGAEANEGAIKLARRWGKAAVDGGSGAYHCDDRYEIITFENAFHGRTLATMSASGKKAFDPLFEPKVAGFFKARLNDLESVRALLTPRTVAVMIEPVQGEAGVIEASPDFMHALRALTIEHDLLLIVDEIQTGVGRTGTLWAYEQAGITPDIMTLGKGLGAGVPLAALVATNAASCFKHGDQGGTWCGNPLMAAVGCAVLDVVADPAFLSTVRSRGDYLRNALSDLSARLGLGPVNGAGLLLALDIKSNYGAAVVNAALERELLINAPRDNLLRFMPALNLSNDEVDEMIVRLGSAIEAVGR